MPAPMESMSTNCGTWWDRLRKFSIHRAWSRNQCCSGLCWSFSLTPHSSIYKFILSSCVAAHIILGLGRIQITNSGLNIKAVTYKNKCCSGRCYSFDLYPSSSVLKISSFVAAEISGLSGIDSTHLTLNIGSGLATYAVVRRASVSVASLITY